MCGFVWLVHQLVWVALFDNPNMFPYMIPEDLRRAQSQGALSSIAVSGWYVLPIGWLYGTYHLLREPGNSIDFLENYGFYLHAGLLSIQETSQALPSLMKLSLVIGKENNNLQCWIVRTPISLQVPMSSQCFCLNMFKINPSWWNKSLPPCHEGQPGSDQVGFLSTDR